MLESVFQAKLVDELEELFEGCIILKNDANQIQGFPDLLILYNEHWAALECKRTRSSHRQPNQEFYVSLLENMSFSRFIYPENKEEILDELQQTFSHRRTTRLPKR